MPGTSHRQQGRRNRNKGVYIIQKCEVTGFNIDDGVCKGVEPSRAERRKSISIVVLVFPPAKSQVTVSTAIIRSQEEFWLG